MLWNASVLPPAPFATPTILLGSLKTLEESHPLNYGFKSNFVVLAHSVMRVELKLSVTLGVTG